MRWATLGGVVVAMNMTTAAAAQLSTRVELDNDSFNFWQAPKVRADREYSQGTRITLQRPSASRLARRLLGGPDQCVLTLGAHDCRMLAWSLTQAIYTPTLDARRRQPGERPYAGWLGAEAGLQRERERSLHAVAFGLGVTGPASMAEPAQKAVHRLFNFQKPQGWEGQLPSEVAFVASYRGARSIVQLDDRRSGLRLMLAPVWTLQAGTVATDATVGVQATLGLRPPSPWRGASNLRGDRWGLYLRAGAQQTAVARNLFLDGSTFTSSARVEKNRLVGQTDLGAGIRMPLGMLEWQVHSRGREYRMQPRAHAYSTIAFSLR